MRISFTFAREYNSNSPIKHLKYIPKLSTSLIFLVLFGIVLILFLGRTIDALRMESILSVLPEFYAHISNFSISYFLFAGIGYFWLMAGANFKFIIGLGSVILLSNFIFELFIDVLNTPDIIDAYYGLAGVVFAFVFLILTQKFGLTVNSMAADTVRELD